MTEKRLYALNESDVVKLTKLAKGFEAVSTRLGHLDDVRLNRGFIAPLTPLDTDAAIERMCTAFYEGGADKLDDTIRPRWGTLDAVDADVERATGDYSGMRQAVTITTKETQS